MALSVKDLLKAVNGAGNQVHWGVDFFKSPVLMAEIRSNLIEGYLARSVILK